jgi:hypothetical protein
MGIHKDSTIKNLKLTGDLGITINPPTTAQSMIGTVAGWNEGIIRNVTSSVNLTVINNSLSSVRVGGITGSLYRGKIENCSVSGAVSAERNDWPVGGGNTSDTYAAVYSGGIVGYVMGGEIVNCWGSGAVKAKGQLGRRHRRIFGQCW